MALPHVPAFLSRHRDEDWVAVGVRPRTARDLRIDARRIARAIPSAPEGSEVVIVCHDRYLFAAAFLAALERRLIVALPPNAQPSTIVSLRKREGVVTVLHDDDALLGVHVAERVEDSIEDGDDVPLRSIDPHEVLAIVHTSGSTGAPLRCSKTASQLLGEADTLRRTFAVEAGTRICATVSPHHIYGLLFGVTLPLISGAAFGCDSPLHAEVLAHALERGGFDRLVSVPAHLRALSILEPGRLPELATIWSSGAPLPAETSRDLQSRFGWRVSEVLGSSETGGIAWRNDPDALWQTLEGVRVDTDENERMRVDSPWLDPRTPRPFVTGDRIELISPGTFRHLGRVDGVVKVGGVRVALAEVETRLLALPGVTDAAVLAVEVGGARGHELWALVAYSASFNAADVRASLAAHLDPVVLPRRIRVLGALPREPNGKLQRARALELFGPANRARSGS